MKLPLTAGRPMGQARTAARAHLWAAQRLELGALARLAPLAGVLGVALFLRLYGLNSYVVFYPDTYGQLDAATNLVHGQLPVSYYYPPGVAVALAPAFLVLPDTLLTMQATIMAAGLALVLVAYAACVQTTRDRRAALFLAVAVALGVAFVFHSRVALFDVIATLLIVSALFLAPAMPRRGPAALVAYGVLVFAAATTRHTNAILLPGLFLAALWSQPRPLSWRALADTARSRAVITVGLVVASLYVVYLATAYESLTRFASPQGESVVAASGYFTRLGQYLQAALLGYEANASVIDLATAGGVLALALAGGWRLWRSNRGLLVVALYVIIAWIAVHSLYFRFWARYVMVAHFFVLLLAAVGLSVAIDLFRRAGYPWQRVALAGALSSVVTLFIAGQLAQDWLVVEDLRDAPAARAEAHYEQIREVLRTLDGERATLLSSQPKAVDFASARLTTYDLVEHSGRNGINEASIAKLEAYVDQQLAAGKTVYYHYTGYEATGSHLHKYELGFDAYFAALEQRFAMRELLHPAGSRQRLYVLER